MNRGHLAIREWPIFLKLSEVFKEPLAMLMNINEMEYPSLNCADLEIKCLQ